MKKTILIEENVHLKLSMYKAKDGTIKTFSAAIDRLLDNEGKKWENVKESSGTGTG